MENQNKTHVMFDFLAVSYVEVHPYKENLGCFKGTATIVLNDQLIIRNLRIIDGEKGLFVGYPNDPFYKGDEYRTICSPLTRQLREHIETSILEKYQEAID